MKQRDTSRRQDRRDTIKAHHIEEHRHDPYKAAAKLAEPSACPQCKAVFAGGRWQWSKTAPTRANAHVCPACQRIQDEYPAGEVTLSGAFLAAHADEIVRLVRNIEAEEGKEHPLQRIMGLERAGGRIIVTTTDIHLPRRIGHALTSAYKGELDTHYDETGYFVRMHWRREA